MKKDKCKHDGTPQKEMCLRCRKKIGEGLSQMFGVEIIITDNMKKEKLWKMKTADQKFSDYIRKRDGKCVRCGRTDRQLQCSHYFDRRWFATRYDPDNCVCLCSYCHTFDRDNWEKDRLKEYHLFMVNKLGAKKFMIMEKKHSTSFKKRDAILGVMKLLKK